MSADTAICIIDDYGTWAYCSAYTRCITFPSGETECFEFCRQWGICYFV